MRRRKAAQPLRPYFLERTEGPGSLSLDVRSLVGFDTGATRTNLEAWLAERAGDARRPAVERALAAVDELEDVWALERAAQRRWVAALRGLDVAAREADAFARVRAQEVSYERARSGGPKRRERDEEGDAVRAVVQSIAELRARVAAAHGALARFVADDLSQPDAAGRPRKAALEDLELALFEAGFTTREIARLVVDLISATPATGARGLDAQMTDASSRVHTRVQAARHRREENGAHRSLPVRR